MQHQIIRPSDDGADESDSQFMAWLQLLRLPNIAMMGVLQFLVYVCLLEAWADLLHIRLQLRLFDFWLLSVSAACIAAAGYVINDYFDQEIDQINNPRERFIGRCISVEWAMRVYVALNIVAALPLLGFLYKGFWWLACTHAAAAVSLYAYARWLKKIPLVGNLLIALLCSVLAAEVLWTDYMFHPALLHDKDIYTAYYQRTAWLFVWFVGIATLLREWAKDIEDVQGDTIGKRRTLAVLMGWQGARWLLFACSLLFALVLGYVSWYYWQQAAHYSSLYIGWGLCITLLILVYATARAKSHTQFRNISTGYKVYFGLGMGWLLLFDW